MFPTLKRLMGELSAWVRRMKRRAQAAGDPLLVDTPPHFRVRWCGPWHSSPDGMNETRAVVVQIVEGYVPYLDISHLGGECARGMLGVDPASAVPDLGDAIDRAKAMEAGWLAWDEPMPTGATA